MKQLLFILILVFSSNCINAQKHDNIWPMGYIGDTAAGACNYYIDFTDSFEIIPRCLGVELFQMGSSAISDSVGNLLFYTNGCSIADSSHQIMSNGDGLNNMTDPYYIQNGYPAKTLILPKPKSSNLYYIFHSEFPTNTNGQITYGLPLRLNYSLVELTRNGGLGEVVLKNIPLINDTIAGSGLFLNANKHANGVDWWILVPGCCSSDTYYRFLLTQDSILGPFYQEVSLLPITGGGGQSVFSPDGSLYVRYDLYQADLYDFNRCTGELSYRQQINVPSLSNVGGAAISPNSRFLYIGNDTIVFQYDLQAADINASRVTVAIYDGFISPFPVGFWQMQLAPNGKIYGVSSSSTDRLHVIENPDSAGLACNFRQHAIITPRYNGISLPNFPHFRTPALPAGACDTTGVALLPVVKERVKIYPNPSYNGTFRISIAENSADHVQVHDLLGRLLLQEDWDNAGQEKVVQLPSGAKGIYFVSVWKDGKLIGREKIVVLE